MEGLKHKLWMQTINNYTTYENKEEDMLELCSCHVNTLNELDVIQRSRVIPPSTEAQGFNLGFYISTQYSQQPVLLLLPLKHTR